MPLITLQDVDYGVGGPRLLERVQFTLDRGERVCVVGRNGAGKSSLLRLLAGEALADDGELRRYDSRIALLPQEVPVGMEGSVLEVVAQGVGALGDLLARYHHLSHATGPIDLAALGAVQARIEAEGAWLLEQRVEQTLERLELPAEADFARLSGGMKRRVLLARALVSDPDVLLLDEPTNHLDVEAIAWLEEFLRDFPGGVVFVTHDRAFLRALATRIVEIDRGQLSSWPGDYDNYLRRREERLHAEAQAQAQFDRKLAEEETWIRQGIKARRTRNEGRVTALKAMRRERAARREQVGDVRMAAALADKSGRRVFEARGVSFGYDGAPLVRDFSALIQRGDKVGLIGPNGSGKTTLLRLLLGQLAPQSGEVRQGTQLEIAFFDQMRGRLREDWNALDNVAEGREYITINGSRKHAMGYLQDFLFGPERARAPIAKLSGGERNRLLLAKLFATPSNVLVLDEPTNDLDVETLELLEELLIDYPGTVLLVSHDRAFLDNVVTSVLVMEGNGRVGEYVGGYTDWLRQRPAPVGASAAPARAPATAPAAPSAAAPEPTPPAGKRKLGYKEQRELETLPARIEALEAEIAATTAAMADPGWFRQPAAELQAANRRLAEAQAELDAAYLRWGELE